MICLPLRILVMMMALGRVHNAPENPCYIWGIDVPGDDIRMVNTNGFAECRRECSGEKRSVHRFSGLKLNCVSDIPW